MPSKKGPQAAAARMDFRDGGGGVVGDLAQQLEPLAQRLVDDPRGWRAAVEGQSIAALLAQRPKSCGESKEEKKIRQKAEKRERIRQKAEKKK